MLAEYKAEREANITSHWIYYSHLEGSALLTVGSVAVYYDQEHQDNSKKSPVV